jgi:hypothetical protein
MEGSTIHWFNLLLETEDKLTWFKLKQALIERYGGRHSDNPFEESKDLQQTGGIDDYIMAFEYVSSGREVAGGAILGVLHGGPQDGAPAKGEDVQSTNAHSSDEACS